MFRSIDPEPTYQEVHDHLGESRIIEIEDFFNFQRYLEAAAIQKVRYEFELAGLLRRYCPSTKQASNHVKSDLGTTSARRNVWLVCCYGQAKLNLR